MFLSTLNAALVIDPIDEYAFYNRALTLVNLGLHTHNLWDISAVVHSLDRALANPRDKDAFQMTQVLEYGYMKQ